ncbi:hypothetical protein ISF6_5315 [Piscinibacter sakaiensis]|uniref:DUF393 domain-containing protein n=1 Tax=Piscinibacter sakaiensis TaxID=1547922 RepID=A0A0K8P806_PISS1|nr:hypothetical protein ISF6_5315 [Piscinibacter sakaiensis]
MYYDGGCPLCRAEIAAYRQADAGARLRFVDAQACPAEALGGDLARGDALARLHVRRADGRLVQGAAAFVEVWAALPRWAALARLARLPGVLPLLDLGYAGFLRLRPWWRPAAHPIDALPLPLRRALRTDHAGETGAVMIYRGVLAVTRDPALRAFAAEHLATEARHLAEMDATVPARWRSRLLPCWRLAGWLTGALPALAGQRAVHATVQAVETFVDRHYGEQLAQIDAVLGAADGSMQPGPERAALVPLRELLARCRADEVAHRDDAGARWDGRPGRLLALWCALVAGGSAGAVAVCRRV